MGVKLQSALGGSVELNAPSTASNFTMTVPAGNGTVATTDQLAGFRNRIINGDMRIDQRNAGASVTVNDSNNKRFALDRFFGIGVTTAGVFTLQQSTAAPSGFVNSLVATVTTTATPAASDSYNISQAVEGLNVSDFAWGSASATSVTVSFWVRSSLTGTFGGSLRNSAVDRSYPFSYSIASANTWEQKTITIAGDTSGTWLTTNGVGMYITWSLGSGSSRLGASGSWTSGNLTGATGAKSVVGTSGATFYITGVQLEKGSTATSFDYRPYGTELALCQRYYGTSAGGIIQTQYPAITSQNIWFRCSMRSTPTMTVTANSGTASCTAYGRDSAIITITGASAYVNSNWTASSEL